MKLTDQEKRILLAALKSSFNNHGWYGSPSEEVAFQLFYRLKAEVQG